MGVGARGIKCTSRNGGKSDGGRRRNREKGGPDGHISFMTSSPEVAGIRQNGFTITSTTISTTASPGTSFMIRSDFALIERSPRASLRP